MPTSSFVGVIKMKKFAVVAAAAILAGCTRVDNDKSIYNAWTNHGRECCTKVIEIEGHKYILMDGFTAGGIIHAASCGCMNK